MDQAVHIPASRIEPNFTTCLSPIQGFVNLTIRVDLSILWKEFLTSTKLGLISVVRTW